MIEHSFQEVMREKTRMHEHFVKKYGSGDCGTCPLRYVVCNKPNCEWNEKDYEAIESIVMKWAADHPVPVYPTWAEWLRSLCLTVQRETPFREVGENTINIVTKLVDVLTEKANDPIPEELAVKIGLKPKRLEPNA